MEKEITVNGVLYTLAGQEPPEGPRAVVVVDRGWIFAGDVAEEDENLKLTRAVWVFRWEKIGFDGVLAHPEQAEIRRLQNDVVIPRGSEIFRIPVHESWGL